MSEMIPNAKPAFKNRDIDIAKDNAKIKSSKCFILNTIRHPTIDLHKLLQRSKVHAVHPDYRATDDQCHKDECQHEPDRSDDL